MKETEEKLLYQVAEFLPDAIAKSLKSYRNFSNKKEPADAKAFAEFHKACKVALGHIELLVKLAKSLNSRGQQPPDSHSQADLAALVAEAEAELRGYGQDK